MENFAEGAYCVILHLIPGMLQRKIITCNKKEKGPGTGRYKHPVNVAVHQTTIDYTKAKLQE